MPSSLSGETQASRREVTWPRSPTNQGEALVPARPQPPPDFFLKRGSWWSEVSGERNYTPQRLCLYQGWGLERDRDSVNDKAGRAPSDPDRSLAREVSPQVYIIRGPPSHQALQPSPFSGVSHFILTAALLGGLFHPHSARTANSGTERSHDSPMVTQQVASKVRI